MIDIFRPTCLTEKYRADHIVPGIIAGKPNIWIWCVIVDKEYYTTAVKGYKEEQYAKHTS